MKRRLLFFLAAILTALAGCNNRPKSGDRVLVAKFLSDTHLADPKRFDVVVFKYPKEPLVKNIPKNYIKRLLGLPGEILAIFFGRLYHIPAPEPGAPPYFDDLAQRDEFGTEVNPIDLWKSQYTHDDQSNAKFARGALAKFEIIRKPPDVMMAERRIVYDNDFPAKDLTGPAWARWRTDGNGWTADKDHGFGFQGEPKDAVDWLRYRHVVRPMAALENPVADRKADGERKPQLITDFMGYNSFYSQLQRNGAEEFDRTPKPNWVGDLMIECSLNVSKVEGEFWLELSKGINRFQARFDLSNGMCTLYKLDVDKKKVELDSKPTRVKAPGTYQVRFANIDARLTVWVDRDLPFENGRDYPPPEIRGRDEKDLDDAALIARRGPTINDLEPASIGSNGGAVQVHNIRLWRDTYYTQNASAAADIRDLSAAAWSDPAKWAVFKDMPYKTMYVQPGHYLCLGDNSQQSSDSREWGLVPQRLMLGRALVVYYPFNRAGPIR